MKKIFTILVAGLFTVVLFAQPPQKMSYQCVVRDNSGRLVTNQIIGMKISILQGSHIGIVVFSETQKPMTNENGLVCIEIGGEIFTKGPFTSIDWSSGPYYLYTEIDPAGGTNYTIVGQSQILSVPYALYAEKTGPITETDPLWSGVSSDYYTKTNLYSRGEAQVLFGNLTGKPSTLSGYGILDGSTKSYVDSLFKRIEYLESLAGVEKSITDTDNNSYNIIRIGTQIWMHENLKTTKLNDGTSIPLITENADWIALTTPGHCWYNNMEEIYKEEYGALYNWFAVNTGKLCPVGWHVPSANEWIILIDFLGGGSLAGGKLKAFGSPPWQPPNIGGTNDSGFTGIPAGVRSDEESGRFQYGSQYGYWWSSSEYSDASMALDFGLVYLSTNVIQYRKFKNDGLSVRCIKD